MIESPLPSITVSPVTAADGARLGAAIDALDVHAHTNGRGTAAMRLAGYAREVLGNCDIEGDSFVRAPRGFRPSPRASSVVAPDPD
jgi:hypothetical protein